ncbi:MAG: hypothetical protein UD936_02555 [Acutalibacteraceae bacterium]|nr:hypothetical protein [Acutalibacteraceae bacterium]
MKFIAETFEFTEEAQFPKTKELLNNPIENKSVIESFFDKHSPDVVLACRAMDYVKEKYIGESLKIYLSGGFCWSNEVVYHFKNYDLRLDEEFIDYVLSCV